MNINISIINITGIINIIIIIATMLLHTSYTTIITNITTAIIAANIIIFNHSIPQSLILVPLVVVVE